MEINWEWVGDAYVAEVGDIRLRVAWDDQDPTDPGWAYWVHQQTGQLLGSGPASSHMEAMAEAEEYV